MYKINTKIANEMVKNEIRHVRNYNDIFFFKFTFPIELEDFFNIFD